jgi:hypothetical protein
MQHHSVCQAQALVINTKKRVKKRVRPSKDNREQEKGKSEKKSAYIQENLLANNFKNFDTILI